MGACVSVGAGAEEMRAIRDEKTSRRVAWHFPLTIWMNLWLIEKSNGGKMAEARSKVIEWVSISDDWAA
jgi:hypothetical protein